MLKISVCSENCKKAYWKFQHVLKTVMHVVCLKFQHIKTMLNISGCVENMLKISRHVENYNMCRKLCWNSMLKISACVEHCNACWKPCQNFKACWKCLCYACWKPYWKPCWSTKKRPSHFTARVETERQISFFSFGLHELLKWDIFNLLTWQENRHLWMMYSLLPWYMTFWVPKACYLP